MLSEIRLNVGTENPPEITPHSLSFSGSEFARRKKTKRLERSVLRAAA